MRSESAADVDVLDTTVALCRRRWHLIAIIMCVYILKSIHCPIVFQQYPPEFPCNYVTNELFFGIFKTLSSLRKNIHEMA